jgi:hypothetical protein
LWGIVVAISLFGITDRQVPKHAKFKLPEVFFQIKNRSDSRVDLESKSLQGSPEGEVQLSRLGDTYCVAHLSARGDRLPGFGIFDPTL